MSGVTFLQVLVVAGALCRRNNVICRLERKRHIHRHTHRKMWLGPGQCSKSSTCTQSFHSRISLHTQTSPPVLRLPYITWSQSYFTVFIILHFMCFPPPQIIVFLHPPHTASDYLSLFSSCIVHNQWPHQTLTDQHRPGFWFVLKDAERGRDGAAGLASYTRTSNGLSAPSSSHNSDLSPLAPPPLPLFRVDPWRTEGGGCISVLLRWAAGVY